LSRPRHFLAICDQPLARCLRGRGWWAGMAAALLLAGCTGWQLTPAPPSAPGPMPAAPVNPAATGGQPPVESAQLHGRPGASGTRLNLAPGETAVDRALEVSQKLSSLEEEKRTLTARVQELQNVLQDRERALGDAKSEVQAAKEDVARTRADLERWKQEVAGLRDRLRNAEKENVTTLQSVVQMLEQMMEHDKTVAQPQDQAASDELKEPR
jgi:uncharacterized protein (DUF342 family)